MGGGRRTEHHGPVVVVVAAGRGGGGAVEFVVGDGQARGRVVRDYEHAADEGESVVVDPDTIVAALEVESIASPYDARVDVGEFKTLDDHVLCVLDQGQTLALEHTLSTHTEDRLVAADLQRGRTSEVILDGADGHIVVRGGAGKLAEVELATTGSTAGFPVTAGSSGRLSGEVKLLGDQNHTCSIIREVLGELVRCGRRDGSSTATTSHILGETVSLANDSLS